MPKAGKTCKANASAARALAPEASSMPRNACCFSGKQFLKTLRLDSPVRDRGKKACKRDAQKKILDSVHDAWVSALRSPEGLIYGDENELLQLRPDRECSAHSHPYHFSFQVCFRLKNRL
jgi:hypothetical protein